jgi:hypothetical protein
MAYDASKQRDFLTQRIHEWADIIEMRAEDERVEMIRQWSNYYGEDHPFSRTMFLNLYEITLGYGGPEEGGWWYEEREPIASIPVRSRQAALEMLNHLIGEAEDMYGDSREYTSAAGGEDGHISFETHTARAEPSERPHYA